MSLTVEFEEEFGSRAITTTRDSMIQEFSFVIWGNFLDEAFDDPTYGTDDDLEAQRAAYQIIPLIRVVPCYDGSLITLTLASMKITQLSKSAWRVEVSYDIPDNGGGGGGGYEGDIGIDVGPNAGDYQKWSNEYVQISVNASHQTIRRTMSLKTVAIHKSLSAPNQTIPYTVGKPAPIGQTLDSVEGADVYARSFAFGVTAYVRPQKLTFPYVRRLSRMQTTLNDGTFFGFPRGSVCFLEYNFSSDLFSLVPLALDFEVRPNFKLHQTTATTLCDPDEDDPTKMFDIINDPFFPTPAGSPIFSGWCTMDYRYAPAPEGASAMILQKPILRIVHLNYEHSDFARFEL